MLAAKTGSPKAAGGGGGNQEPAGKHCSDVEELSEDSDDDEEVLETAQNGRWQKINVQVSWGTTVKSPTMVVISPGQIVTVLWANQWFWPFFKGKGL